MLTLRLSAIFLLVNIAILMAFRRRVVIGDLYHVIKIVDVEGSKRYKKK